MAKRTEKRCTPFLPEELIVGEILVRLSVKEVFQFKCVSKSYLRTIESPNFTKLHLNSSIQTQNNPRLILKFLYINHFVYTDDLNRFPGEMVKVMMPREYGRNTAVRGCCHGLILLQDVAVSDRRKKLQTLLWNPFIRRHKKLPSCPIKIPPVCRVRNYVGFAYDSTVDDYKVVRISRTRPRLPLVDACTQFCVYSWKADSWGVVKDITQDGYFVGCAKNRIQKDLGSFADGALHWLCNKVEENDSEKEVLVAFDLATESFRKVELPVHLTSVDYTCLGVLGGCLCICLLPDKFNDRVELYFRKMDGLGSFSWQPMCTIPKYDIDKYVTNYVSESGGNFVMPLAYSKERNKILFSVGDEVLFWYDLDQKRGEVCNVGGVQYLPDWLKSFDSFVCSESMVSPGNGSSLDDHRYRISRSSKRKCVIY